MELLDYLDSNQRFQLVEEFTRRNQMRKLLGIHELTFSDYNFIAIDLFKDEIMKKKAELAKKKPKTKREEAIDAYRYYDEEGGHNPFSRMQESEYTDIELNPPFRKNSYRSEVPQYM
jgi:hypothetical protein